MKTIHREENSGPEYWREGWYAGGTWKSLERGVVPGAMRVINGIVMRAWTVKPRFLRKSEIHWVSVDPSALRKVDINERPSA